MLSVTITFKMLRGSKSKNFYVSIIFCINLKSHSQTFLYQKKMLVSGSCQSSREVGINNVKRCKVGGNAII